MARSHDHAYVKPNADTRDKRVEAQRQRLDGSAAIQPIRLNIANKAVKQMCKIIFGILKSAFPLIFIMRVRPTLLLPVLSASSPVRLPKTILFRQYLPTVSIFP